MFNQQLGRTKVIEAAVNQAAQRLAAAKKAFKELESAKNFADAETAWSDFLFAINTIYSKLEQGSKNNGKSARWFGLKRHDQKKDPALRYLKAARNCDEHNIEPATVRSSGSIALGGKVLPFGAKVPLVGRRAAGPEGPVYGDPFELMAFGPRLELATVYDRRHNQRYEPPTTHMGKEISYSAQAPSLAAAVLPYFDQMVKEAAELAGMTIVREITGDY